MFVVTTLVTQDPSTLTDFVSNTSINFGIGSTIALAWLLVAFAAFEPRRKYPFFIPSLLSVTLFIYEVLYVTCSFDGNPRTSDNSYAFFIFTDLFRMCAFPFFFLLAGEIYFSCMHIHI
jgi:hypothetical protein